MKNVCHMCGAEDGKPHHDRSLGHKVQRRIVRLLSVPDKKDPTKGQWICSPCYEGQGNGIDTMERILGRLLCG